MPAMTKSQLVDENIRLRAQLEFLEQECALAKDRLNAVCEERDIAVDGLHRLRSEMLAERCNNAVITTREAPVAHRVVEMRGQRYMKVPSTVGGRTVFTYKPLSA